MLQSLLPVVARAENLVRAQANRAALIALDNTASDKDARPGFACWDEPAGRVQTRYDSTGYVTRTEHATGAIYDRVDLRPDGKVNEFLVFERAGRPTEGTTMFGTTLIECNMPPQAARQMAALLRSQVIS